MGAQRRERSSVASRPDKARETFVSRVPFIRSLADRLSRSYYSAACYFLAA